MEASENFGGESSASRARAGSLHNHTSGIHISSRLSHIRSEVEAWEVTVLALDSEAESEEDMDVGKLAQIVRKCNE